MVAWPGGSVYLLDNAIMPYAWGSRAALATLMGRPAPSATPEAELWMGAHPQAPSTVLLGGRRRRLDEVIAESPTRELGARVRAELGDTLPFLLKVLAAQTPLSLQAHPSLEQAREGFAREEALGILRDAPERCYRDPNHKPELLAALTRFEALCGFRALDATLALLAELAVAELAFLREALARDGDAGLRRAFAELMTLDARRRERVVAVTLDACRRCADGAGRFAAELGWALRLGALHPGDAGVVSALLLNHVVLEPGDALYLPAGNLHAYLSGVGVELMASSDNVLRGGLTPKHVDVPELLRILEFTSGDVVVLRAAAVRSGEAIWHTPAREFTLSRLDPTEGRSLDFGADGPEILLATRGRARIECGAEALTLEQGQSAFLGAADGPHRLSGDATVFRATVGLADVGSRASSA